MICWLVIHASSFKQAWVNWLAYVVGFIVPRITSLSFSVVVVAMIFCSGYLARRQMKPGTERPWFSCLSIECPHTNVPSWQRNKEHHIFTLNMQPSCFITTSCLDSNADVQNHLVKLLRITCPFPKIPCNKNWLFEFNCLNIIFLIKTFIVH